MFQNCYHCEKCSKVLIWLWPLFFSSLAWVGFHLLGETLSFFESNSPKKSMPKSQFVVTFGGQIDWLDLINHLSGLLLGIWALFSEDPDMRLHNVYKNFQKKKSKFFLRVRIG